MFKTQINRLLLAVVVFNFCAVIGCHRGFYRRQADAEASRLIRQKSNDPRWDGASGNIDINPQSRMFDPFSADHPPIPPDDAASHQFMYCVDGKEGYPHWHSNGDTNFVENPEWLAHLPVNENGQVVLTLHDAYQLALIHSPELQRARETLYLSALDVSLDRFGFDSQLFWGTNSTSAALTQGNTAIGRSGNLSLERLGITGANFVVGLANTVLFNFGGSGDAQTANTLLDFSLIQPLLRGAGRDRILEALTQSERTLLANVRQLERFRRGIYLQVAVGRGLPAALNRAGDFLGTPRTAGTGSGGFIGLLEQQQRIRNSELNVRQLESVLELFREFFLRDRLDPSQLKRFETDVYGAQRDLLDLIAGYQTTLDAFKITLGLPPDLDVVIDDSYLDRFKLISDQVNDRLILTGNLRQETGAVLNQIDELFAGLDSVDDIANFPWPADLSDRLADLLPFIEQASSTLENIVTEDRAEIEADIAYLESKRESRLAYLNKLKNTIESGQIISPVDASLFEADSVPETAEIQQELANIESPNSILNRAAAAKQELAGIKTSIQNFEQNERELDKTQLYRNVVLKEIQEKIPGVLSEINNVVLELSLLQASTRSNSIEIIDVDIESTEAIDIARCMRRDWMNARATLVDNWRNIEFVADQLEAQVDLVFEGDIGNVGANPFKLQYETGQLRAGFRFDAPIVRMAERNNYRQALINYQQTRREFYQFEDAIKRNLREIKRNIDRNKVRIELDRRSVQTSIENVELRRYELEEPVAPGAQNRLATNAAESLSNAIRSLNNTQNSFLRSWVEYEVLRRNLDYDMGTMLLDEADEWIDPGEIDSSIGMKAAAMMGIELDCQFCTGVVTPLGFDPNLNFFPAPAADGNVTQPGPLEFESEPTPAEPKGNLIPSTPQMNRPESGMLQRRSFGTQDSASTPLPSERVPRQSFTPVKIKASVARAKVERRLKEQSLERRQKLAVASKSDPQQSAAGFSRSSNLMVADRIANQYSMASAKQTSLVTPASTSISPAASTHKTPTKGKSVDSLRVESEFFRPIPPLETVENSTTVSDSQSGFHSTSGHSSVVTVNSEIDWSSRPSSLGGVLNRFRADAEK